MTFEEAMALQPIWVQVWVWWMVLVTVVAIVALLFSRPTRRDAAILLVVTVANTLFMQWLFAELGFVRLLGLSHVIFWTPLAVYLWLRLNNEAIKTPFRQVIWVLLATISASLVFDYVDVARYLLGARAPLAQA
jgi:hypothetical protein